MNDESVNQLSDASDPDQFDATKVNLIALGVGAAYGILMRLIFSAARDSVLTTMSFSFAVLVPVIVGALTVYTAERYRRRSIKFYIFGPWLSVIAFVLGTGLMLLEGSICIVMALPLFLIEGSVGGLVMGLLIRWLRKPVRTLQSVAVLPLLVAMSQVVQETPNHYQEIVSSVYIDAPTNVIWEQIVNPYSIKPEEFATGIVYQMGVPRPIEAKTDFARIGGKRHARMERGVSFDEIITEWQLERKISWRYQFSENSFPPGSMDDHVVIGGQYFDLTNTSYILTPEANGTRLTIVINYRVSTQFNAYAVPMSTYLISNTADALLHFYKHRSEELAMK